MYGHEQVKAKMGSFLAPFLQSLNGTLKQTEANVYTDNLNNNQAGMIHWFQFLNYIKV